MKSTLTEEQIAELLAPYLRTLPLKDASGDDIATVAALPSLYGKCALYLDLLLSWNARTNLTAIRSPEQMVRRHFGESFFAGLVLRSCVRNGSAVLDFGSGAGFPGLPVQLLLPEIQVTLAESQGKKAAFLREAVRLLDVRAEVWSKRVEELPSEKRFEAVMMRGVDDPARMRLLAVERVQQGGCFVGFETGRPRSAVGHWIPGLDNAWIEISKPNE